MSATLQQIYTLNPATTILDTDLLYLVQSPYTPGTDAGISGATLKSLFVLSTAVINVAHGGTGSTSFTPYSVITAGITSTGSFQNVSGVGVNGQVLTSQGAGALPQWSNPATSGTVTSISAGTGITLTPNPIVSTGSVALTVPVTEILGGTNQTTYTLGDILYSSAANTLSKLAGNITTAKQYLSQTGTGAVSAAPAWATISGGDITGAALTASNDTNVTLTLGGTPTTALLRAASITAGWTGQLSLARGGTNSSLTADNGGIVYSTATALALLASTATAGKILQSGSSAAPSWSTATYPSTAGTSGNVLTSDGTNWNSSSVAGIGSPLTTKGDIYAYSTTNARFPVAVGDGKVLQVSSGATFGIAYSTPTYPSASGTSGKFLISDGTNNVYSTSTIPTSAGATANKVLLSDGTNYVLSTPTFPNASATTGKIIISDGTNWIASTPTYPAAAGTSGNVLTSNGTNWISSAPTGTGTVNSGTIGQIAYYAATGTAVSGENQVTLAQGGTNASLTASNGGIFYSTATAGAILAGTATANQVLMSGSSTTPAWSTATYPATTTINQILYSSSNNIIAGITAAASSVLVSNGSNVPSWSTTLPAFTTSSITFNPTTGGIVGTTTNDNVAAGSVGEYVSSNIAFASATSISTTTATNLTSISLTAGDWNVGGNIYFIPTVGASACIGGISTTSATLPDNSRTFSIVTSTAILGSTSALVPETRISIASTTTIYIVGFVIFGAGTCTQCGNIWARRVR